jgi:hypothetical protein
LLLKELETSVQPLKNTSANHLPVILKSDTETASKFVECFTIMSGLQNSLENHMWLPECHNKHFGILKRLSVRIFKISTHFIKGKEKKT